MNYIVSDNDICGCFSENTTAIIFLLDSLISKLNFIIEINKINNNIILPKYNNLEIKCIYYDSSIIKHRIIFDLNNFKFKDILSHKDYFIDNKQTKIMYKIKFIKSLKLQIDNCIYENNNKNELIPSEDINNNKNELIPSEDINNELISSEDINNSDDNNSDDNCIYDNNSNDNCIYDNNSDNNYISDNNNSDNNKLIEEQKNLISELTRKKLIIEKKQTQKNEKIQEINRRFKIDYELYFKIKKNFCDNNIPILFQNVYNIFKELEEDDIINNEIKAKLYYENNYNRVTKNIGSSLFSNIFNKEEIEEINKLSETDMSHSENSVSEISDSENSYSDKNKISNIH